MTSLSSVSKTLLRASYPPINEQKAAAKRSLARGALKLQSLEDEVSRLRDLSQRLSLEKQTITTFVNCHRALLSPFNRLPADVIEEIFYHCLPVAHNAIMSVVEAPLFLGRVCSRWRQIVHSAPRLWTSIHIVASTSLSTAPRPGDLSRLEAISSWFLRSGILPLSISLHDEVPPPRNKQGMNLLPPEVTIILSHARRWRSIYLKFQGEMNWLPDFFSQLSTGDVPLLQNLLIDYPVSTPWNDTIVAALSHDHSLLNAPQLRSLALPSGLATNCMMSIQWRNLTALHIQGDRVFRYSELAQIMMQCPSLETWAIVFSLSAWDPWETPPSPSSPRYPPLSTLQRLRSLTFITGHGSDRVVCQLLERLSAPALMHFAYHQKSASSSDGWGHSGPSAFAQENLVRWFHTFLNRLTDPLEELDLWLDSFEKSVLLEILQSVPRLRRLFLGGKVYYPQWWNSHGSHYDGWGSPIPQPSHPLDDSILDRFIPSKNGNHVFGSKEDYGDGDQRSGKTCFCPDLEVACFSLVEFSDQVVIKFLRSRTVLHSPNSVSRLRKVKITSCLVETQDTDIASQLAALKKETGLQAHLQYTRSTFPSAPPVPSSRGWGAFGSHDGASIGHDDLMLFF